MDMGVLYEVTLCTCCGGYPGRKVAKSAQDWPNEFSSSAISNRPRLAVASSIHSRNGGRDWSQPRP